MSTEKGSARLIWLGAVLTGSVISFSLFAFIPALGKKPEPLKPQVMHISVSQWQPPAVKKTHQKPTEQVKSAPKPKPKPLPKPLPKPTPIPKPTPKPAPPTPVVQAPIPEMEKSETESETVVATDTTETTEEFRHSDVQPTQNTYVLPEPHPIFELTALPRFSHKKEPIYPETEKILGREAKVVLEVLIDDKGNVRDINIAKSAGTAFDDAAINAVKQSSFSPGEVNGKPVTVRYRLPVSFKLK